MYLRKFQRKFTKSLEDQPQVAGSVTWMGDLLDFGKLFKAFGNN